MPITTPQQVEEPIIIQNTEQTEEPENPENLDNLENPENPTEPESPENPTEPENPDPTNMEMINLIEDTVNYHFFYLVD